MDEIPYVNEVQRKLIHLGALSIPIGFFFAAKPIAAAVLAFCVLISIVIDLARMRQWKLGDVLKPILGPVVRPEESRRFSGATYILTAGLLVVTLFPVPIAAAGMVYIILGDIAAALVGRRFGRHHFRGKTLEGSLAFFVCAALGALLIPELSPTTLVIGAFVATVVEAVTWGIDDNLTVPLISGAVLYWLPSSL